MPARTRPILKWPGGKYRLLDFIIPEFPAGRRLVEPFVGSGAVFINTEYRAYLLADINPDLIAFYQILAERGEEFIGDCRKLFTEKANAPDAFYRHRDRFNAMPAGAERSALFLYFNRHGYNGLIRYNAAGKFNVPFGRYVRPYFPEAEMRAFIDKTRRAKVDFMVGDFRQTFAKVRGTDIVYCDPPYIPLSSTANFTGYAGNTFGPDEQRGLARMAEDAAAKGARVVVSNHDAGDARELYRGAAYVRETEVRRFISCNGQKREMVKELLAVYTGRVGIFGKPK